MTKIESKTVQVNVGPESVFAFLTDLNNFRELLPGDKISDWSSDGTSCVFKVQGGYKIGLALESSEPHSSVIYRSTAESPFRFTLHVHLEPVDGGTRGWQVCEAELNPFLRMMVEKPLKNLFDYIADQLSSRFRD
jgi:carbon monoxide dehydrogenase subunit G